MKPRIEAVTYFNRSLYKDFKALKILNYTREIRLWENTDFEEVNSIIARLFKETKAGAELNVVQTLQTISEKGFDYFASLKFTNDKAEMYSGCCFNFPDWHELMEITREKSWIWLGHDPTTFIEYRSNQDKPEFEIRIK